MSVIDAVAPPAEHVQKLAAAIGTGPAPAPIVTAQWIERTQPSPLVSRYVTP